jgi:SAM-dependent methyltransferase
MEYICNLCGFENETDDDRFDREGAACGVCGGIVRLRTIGYRLGQLLFETDAPVPDWPEKLSAVAIGVSDWPRLEDVLSDKLRYINTQFDEDLRGGRPFLDITNPSQDFLSSADVVICSDVLEHVEPPVQGAFDGLFSLLKSDGVLIMTVPYDVGKTVEHFPELFDWKFENLNGRRILRNTTRAGEEQTFSNLVYHGGGEQVLEMRVFGLDDLRNNLASAGFGDVTVMDYDVPKYGIIQPEIWGRTITARRLRDAD